MTDVPWLTRAREDLKTDTREVPGPGVSPFIAGLYRTLKLPVVGDQEYPWCAVYASATLVRCGVKPPARVRAARGFLEWGFQADPRPGALVVLARGEPTDHIHGHVGIFTHEADGRIWLISGNSGNRVAHRDYDPARCVGWRWPKPSDFLTGEVIL